MKIRGRRVFAWILASFFAYLCFSGVIQNTINYLTAEKACINIYAPTITKDAWSEAFKASGLSHEYRGVITDDSTDAAVLVDFGKENDKDYTLFAYSPFVATISNDGGYFKDLKNTKLITPNEFNDSYYEIELMEIIEEVNEQGLWENLGIDDNGKIHVYYPAESTVYWHDFYNFMLLTANGGTYPDTKIKMDNAVKIVQKFLDSSCTEGITDYKERLTRTDGIPTNVIYLGTEQELAYTIWQSGYKGCMLFPKVTSNFNLYVKSNSELGSKLLGGMNSNFYGLLSNVYFRSNQSLSINTKSDYVSDLRNVYEVQQIPDENFFTIDFSEDNPEE